MAYIFRKEYIVFVINVFLVFLFFVLIEILTVHNIDFKFLEILAVASVAVNITSYIFYKRTYYKVFPVIFLFFISVLYIQKNNDPNINYDVVQYLLAFYVGVTNCLLILSGLLNKKLKILSYIIYFFMFLPTLFIWQYFFISNGFVSPDTILAIFQTNFSEIKSYMNDFIGIKQYIGLMIILVVSFIVIRFANKLKINNLKSKTTVIFLIISVWLNFLLIYVYKYKSNIVTNVFAETEEYLDEYNNFKKLAEERNISSIKIDKDKQINKGVYVLVIGESQNKEHMSAYGYTRKTTPWLDNMGKNKNFIKFTNAYSCHTHTVPVLSYALTNKNQYNDINLGNAFSILDVAKAANIQTVWLSNQVHYGIYDTPVSIIADSAQQQSWINKNFGKTNDTTFYDINLINELEKINLYDDMLIIVHLMGNHGTYKDRYPKEFNIFKNDKKVIAEYDNSILYNDFVMENIFKTVKEIPNFKALIYFADHADAVDYGLGHDVIQYVPSMTDIPMYIYFSDEYISENKEIYDNLCSNKNYFFTNDLMFNLVCGILNLKISDIYEQNNDITDKNYDNNINRFKTLHGKKNVVKIETILKSHNITPSKYVNKNIITIPKSSIWLHRVNNRNRLKYYLNKYDGFEIDIRFNEDKKYFNVSHDNDYGNEDLFDMLKNIDGLKDKYLWLDFKNLSERNKNIALNTLNKIVENNNLIKEHIIVENSNPKALNVFKQAGYYTSFYLNCYNYDDIDKLPKVLLNDIKKLEESNVDFVSSDAKYFDIVEYCFPNIAHLFWVMDKGNTTKTDTDYILKKDNNTYVVLNQDMRKYYN